MPQVFVEKPDSFLVQDFLGALFAAQYPKYFMIDPLPSSGESHTLLGRAIHSTLVNIPAIGISSQGRTPDRLIGFIQPAKVEVDDNDLYEIEAMLLLEVNPKDIPSNMTGETWVLQVKEMEKIDLFQPIAVALAEQFNVNVIITPATMRDSDPAHLNPRPVREDIAGSPMMCQVIIRKVE